MAREKLDKTFINTCVYNLFLVLVFPHTGEAAILSVQCSVGASN